MSGVEKAIALELITSNIYKRRPVAGSDEFWLYEYLEDADVNIEDSESPDFFTQRAISLVQKTTAREVFGLTLKDIMGMDYGFFLYLERLIEEAERVRAQKLEEIEQSSKSEQNE